MDPSASSIKSLSGFSPAKPPQAEQIKRTFKP